MATAQEAARARDEAEQEAETLYEAAVAYVASRAAVADGESDEDDDMSLVVAAGVALAFALILSLPRRYGSDISVDDLDVDPQQLANELGEDYARQAVKDATAHLGTIQNRAKKQNPAVTGRQVRDAFQQDEAWIKAAARTATTEAATHTAVEMLPLVDEVTGKKHQLLWVSRGDHKVRSSHRKLHGKVRALGKPFKRFSDGRTLRFPGDPLAPMEEWINCRCGLLLVPAAEARSAMDLFQVSEDEWSTIDSLRASVGWDQDEDDALRASMDLTAERSIVHPG